MDSSRALVITTYDLLARGVEEMLAQAGIHVCARVTTWEEAHPLLETTPPDIIIVAYSEQSPVSQSVWTYLINAQHDTVLVLVDANENQALVFHRQKIQDLSPHIFAQVVKEMVASGEIHT